MHQAQLFPPDQEANERTTGQRKLDNAAHAEYHPCRFVGPTRGCGSPIDSSEKPAGRADASTESRTDWRGLHGIAVVKYTQSGREDYIDKGFMHTQVSPVFNEAEPPKPIHKETHP